MHMKGETKPRCNIFVTFVGLFWCVAFDFIGCCGTVAMHSFRLTCGKGYWTSAKLCCRFVPLIQVVLYSCKKICSKHVGGLSDWIPGTNGISIWFGKHASPSITVPGSQAYWGVCSCNLLYSLPYFHLHFQNWSMRTVLATASAKLLMLSEASISIGVRSLWWVLGIFLLPGYSLVHDGELLVSLTGTLFPLLFPSETSSLKSPCSLCRERRLFRLPLH